MTGLAYFSRGLRTSAAAARSRATPAVAFDMDGVLMRGGRPIPRASKALERLLGDNSLNKQFPFVILTNSGGESEEQKAHKLSKSLQIPILPEQMILSHTPMKRLASHYKDKLVLVVGKDECKSVARSYGFKSVVSERDVWKWRHDVWPFAADGSDLGSDFWKRLGEYEGTCNLTQTPISAIMVFHDPPNWGLAIQVIIDALLSANGCLTTRLENPSLSDRPPIPLFAANRDVVFSSGWTFPRMGQGAFLSALEGAWKAVCEAESKSVTGRTHKPTELQVVQFGKPFTETYAYAENIIESLDPFPPADSVEAQPTSTEVKQLRRPVYAIGDNPLSDIVGANCYGWTSILVKTGVYQGDPHSKTDFSVRGDGENPHLVCEDVLDAVNLIVDREVSGNQ
ncbi:hypothetical protein HDU85_003417 [Gaertneriomyces sp. JEL0708]|nr:hypothetical protein HDU85_003417 [Gaertneriomyces sp. JEL0708]